MRTYLHQALQLLINHRKKRQLVDALPFFLQQLGTALSGGLSLHAALRQTSSSSNSPWGVLIAELLLRHHNGANWNELWQEVLHDYNCEETELLVATVLLSSDTGAGIRQSLSRLEQLLTAKHQLRERVQAITAQGRLQGIIMSLLPFFLLLMIQLVDSTYLQPLWRSRFGMTLLALALLNNFLGLIWIRRIIRSFDS